MEIDQELGAKIGFVIICIIGFVVIPLVNKYYKQSEYHEEQEDNNCDPNPGSPENQSW